MGGGDGTLDGGVLAGVGDTLTCEVSGTTVGGLQDDWGLVVTSGFQSCDDGGGGGDVDGWDGELVFLCVVEKGTDVVTDDDTCLSF